VCVCVCVLYIVVFLHSRSLLTYLISDAFRSTWTSTAIVKIVMMMMTT